MKRLSVTKLKQAREQGGFFYLPPRLVIRLTGRDRRRYLNGQVTNDVNQLKIGHAMQALVLTPKGKIAASIYITMSEEALFVEADETSREELLARLERYIISDDVTLETIELAAVAHVFGAFAKHPCIEKAPGTIISRLGIVGKDIECPVVEPLFSLLGEEAVSVDVVEALRLEYGISSLEENSIDYKKGCYMGQEVISRLKSLGRTQEFLNRFVATQNPQ